MEILKNLWREKKQTEESFPADLKDLIIQRQEKEKRAGYAYRPATRTLQAPRRASL